MSDLAKRIVLVGLHRIVADAALLSVLGWELVAHHGALAVRRTPSLPEPGVQYGEISREQGQGLVGETLERRLGFWRRRLTDMTALQLAFERSPQRARGDKRPRCSSPSESSWSSNSPMQK